VWTTLSTRSQLPRFTSDVLEPGLMRRQIDAAVRERTERGEAIYTLDDETWPDSSRI